MAPASRGLVCPGRWPSLNKIRQTRRKGTVWWSSWAQNASKETEASQSAPWETGATVPPAGGNREWSESPSLPQQPWAAEPHVSLAFSSCKDQGRQNSGQVCALLIRGRAGRRRVLEAESLVLEADKSAGILLGGPDPCFLRL